MAKKDYYEVLGVDKNATEQDIKLAFRRLAKKYHPDVSKEANSEEKFKEIQEAYAVLSDPEKRKQYDQFGHAAFENGGFSSQGGFGNFGGFGGFSNMDFDFDLGDIFGDLFGGRRTSNTRRTKGNDRLIVMDISFMEAARGCQKDLELSTTEVCSNCDGKGGFNERVCSECNGSGTITEQQRTMFGSFLTRTTCPKCEGTGKTYERVCSVCRGKGVKNVVKTVTIKVPEGVASGNRIRLSGYGEPSLNKGVNGDLYIEFKVKDHDYYTRNGNDIYIEVPLTITEAILGCKKDIKLPNSVVTLTIPSGAQTLDKHRIRGKGIKDVDSNRYGDAYIVLKVITPRHLNREQKSLIDKLDKTSLVEKELVDYENFLKS